MISIRDLSFSFSLEKKILRNISLQIEAGETFGIIGPTGAGKSTLLLHLNGILQQEGQVWIDGQRLEKKTSATIRSKVGLVFQNPDDQLFCPTVFEDVAFGLFNQGLDAAEVEQRVDRILVEMNLAEYKQVASHQLSYGEKKRLALATVLVMKPKILALDEPFANLDYRSMLLLVRLIKKMAITRIIVSQDILHAFVLCQRIAVLDHGEIVTVGTAADISKEFALLERIGLDYRPYLHAIQKFM